MPEIQAAIKNKVSLKDFYSSYVIDLGFTPIGPNGEGGYSIKKSDRVLYISSLKNENIFSAHITSDAEDGDLKVVNSGIVVNTEDQIKFLFENTILIKLLSNGRN
ncbi:MAG: hypothetical protein BGO69_11305 [Bacteroidetes bacterium 46-16]|nr:MAG: hypothetical protein BGO69_11305 [Bacteroidetes bacterium 46-16]